MKTKLKLLIICISIIMFFGCSKSDDEITKELDTKEVVVQSESPTKSPEPTPTTTIETTPVIETTIEPTQETIINSSEPVTTELNIIEESPTIVEPEITYNYIGNINSKKFHRMTCKTLPKEENRYYFETREEAVSEGFDPCKNCDP